jgi:Zn-dependent protease
MCIPNRLLDKKTRRLMAIGNISLVIGLLLWLFVHPSGQMERNWFHGVCGFLLGLSITINLFGLWVARRCRAGSS